MATRTLRQATVADLPQLAKLAEEFYAASEFLTDLNVPHFVKFWEDILNYNIGILFLLLDGDQIVGTIGGIAHREPYNDSFVAQECALFISEAARGGTGLLRLYRAFETWAAERRCSRIRMGFLHDSMPEKMGRLYRVLGFAPCETMWVKELQNKN